MTNRVQLTVTSEKLKLGDRLIVSRSWEKKGALIKLELVFPEDNRIQFEATIIQELPEQLFIIEDNIYYNTFILDTTKLDYPLKILKYV